MRITGFKPYFYVDRQPDLNAAYEIANKKWDSKFGPNKGQKDYAFNLSKKISEFVAPVLSKVEKYDVFAGFAEFKKKTFYKVTCESLAIFRGAKSAWKNVRQYESNLPPFLRLS